MTGIFISYRREQNDAHAHLLRKYLHPLFRGRVFMDVAGTDYGDDFTTKITQQLKDCRVMLVLIGPAWESLRDEGLGGLRLQNPKDWVRVEVATALKRNIRVIPVLVKRTRLPLERDLPDDLKPLVNRQALVLDLDQRLDQAIRDLVEAIRPDMGRGVSVPDWVKWVVPVLGLVAGGGYLAMNPLKWPEAAVAPPVPARIPGTLVPSLPLVGQVMKDCDVCPELVVLPQGSFVMGSPDGEPRREKDEGPQRTVKIGYTLAVGKYEVTQGQWKAVMGSNPSPSAWFSWFSWCGDACPVENVSWDMAQEYLKKLNARSGQKYRLLSEAEWEYAARAGTMTPFHTGKTITPEQANFDGNYTYNGSAKGVYREKTVKVGSFDANAFGLHDMHGNVWEWVQDCWHESYQSAPSDGTAWETECSGSEVRRFLRGGSWINGPMELRSARRNWFTAALGTITGVRIARTLR